MHLFDQKYRKKHTVTYSCDGQNYYFFGETSESSKHHLFVKIFCKHIINAFMVTFDQFNAPLLNQSISFLKKNITNPKLLSSSVYIKERYILKKKN